MRIKIKVSDFQYFYINPQQQIYFKLTEEKLLINTKQDKTLYPYKHKKYFWWHDNVFNLKHSYFT